MQNDAVNYAAVRMFIPQRRLVWRHIVPSASPGISIGGMPGDLPNLPGTASPAPPSTPQNSYWIVAREDLSTEWDLLNQNWSCQLVPAVQPALATILQTQPDLPAFSGSNLKMPNLSGVSGSDIRAISTH